MFNRRRFVAGLFGGAAAAATDAVAAEPKLSAEAALVKSIVDLKGEAKFILLRVYAGELRVHVNPTQVTDFKGDYPFKPERVDALATELRRMYPKAVMLVSKYANVQMRPVNKLNEEPEKVENGIYFISVEDDKVVLIDTVCQNGDVLRLTYNVTFDGQRTHKHEVAREVVYRNVRT